jgi:hypothetical protein
VCLHSAEGTRMAKNRVKMMIAVALASTESELAADTASILFFSFFRLYHKTNLINS